MSHTETTEQTAIVRHYTAVTEEFVSTNSELLIDESSLATGVYLLYPSTIDLEELTLNPLLQSIDGFNKDELCYILQLPRYLPTVSEKTVTKHGYTKIKSTIAQRFVRKYNHYLDALCDAGILDTDSHFIIGKKAYGYKFKHPHHASPLAKHKVATPAFAKKLRKFRQVPQELKGEYDHLTRWFNGLLTIDEKAAQCFVVEYQKTVKNDAVKNIFQIWSGGESDQRKFNKYNRRVFAESYDYMFGVHRVIQDWFTLTVDDTAGRFHSNLTNLKSELRNALTYNGEELVSVDLKNSQPFMSLLLLNPDFYRDSYQIKIPEGFFPLIKESKMSGAEHKHTAPPNTHQQPNNKPTSSNTSTYTLHTLDPDIASRVIGLASTTSSSTALITLAESKTLTESEDVLLYRKLVEDGELYEYLEEFMIAEGLPKPKDRKELKGIMFQVLFTANSYLNQPEAASKRLFAKAFPTVFELFSLIKGRMKRDLPVLLQKIESSLFIDTISKRISRERPTLPIFTIHDSIVTTSGNEQYVQDVMREELQRAIGATPSFDVDYYTLQKLDRLTCDLRTANLLPLDVFDHDA